MKESTLKTDLGMLFITIIWGFGFVATKLASEYCTANQILFYRFLTASAVMLAIFHKDITNIGKKDILRCAVLGIFLSLGFYFQTSAIYYTTVSKNAFLTTLNVIFVPIIVAAVHKTRIDAYSIAGCLLAICGTGVLSLNSDFTINFGDVLSILCAVFFSFHIFLQGEFASKTKTSVLATGQIVSAGVISFAVSLFSRDIKVITEPKPILGILYLSVMSTCVAFFIQACCQKRTSPVKAVVIFSMEAVFASIFAVIFFGDAITPRFLLGSSIILIAVIVSSTKLVFLRVLTNKE